MTAGSRPDPPTSLLFDVFALNQACGKLLDGYMAASSLTPAEYALYSAVFELESVSPSALAARLGMPLTTVMDHIARLERRGHARRIPDPRDGRATRVVLTAAGLAAHRAANVSFERAYAAFESALGADAAQAKVAMDLMRLAVETATAVAQNRPATMSAQRSG